MHPARALQTELVYASDKHQSIHLSIHKLTSKRSLSGKVFYITPGLVFPSTASAFCSLLKIPAPVFCKCEMIVWFVGTDVNGSENFTSCVSTFLLALRILPCLHKWTFDRGFRFIAWHRLISIVLHLLLACVYCAGLIESSLLEYCASWLFLVLHTRNHAENFRNSSIPEDRHSE